MFKVRTIVPLATTEVELKSIQEEFSKKVHFKDPKYVASAAVEVRNGKQFVVAATFSMDSWKPVETTEQDFSLDYQNESLKVHCLVQGLLSLQRKSQIIFVGEHGRLHPQKFGIACHVGLSLDFPTVGVSLKEPSLKLSQGVLRPPWARGNSEVIHHGGEALGLRLCTQKGQDPVFVSVGHKLTLETAQTFVLRSCLYTRMPTVLNQVSTLAKNYAQRSGV